MTPRHTLTVALVAFALAACSGGDQVPEPEPTVADEPVATSSAPAEDDASATTTAAPPPDPAPTTTAPEPPPEPALGASGVSAGHPLAAEAGMQMLERGGSAVDAAIAAAFTDAVTQPSSSGIGGGGVAIVAADGEAVNYDYREVVNAQGEVPEDGVGVPGFIAGMQRLHEEHGELPWEVLLEPAITVAEDGHPVSDFVAVALRTPNGEAATGDLPHFRSGGAPLEAGDLLVQTDLAATMRTLAQEGASSFYTGSLSGRVARVPGLDARTLQDYDLQVSAPAAGELGQDILLSGAPPLPGAAIVQMAQVAEAGGIGDVGPDSAAFVDLLSQAWLVADRTVQEDLGDPAFVDVPLDRITDRETNAALAADVFDEDGGVAAVADPYDSAPNTTHISVVDEDGVGVSMTNTLTSFWGSGRYLDGYFLNDQLSRFFAIGVSDANEPEPGRRSVSWSAPSMLVDQDYRPLLVVGTPGGRQIPSTTASVVLRWALHDQPLDQAVPAGRFLLSDGRLRLEEPRLAGELRSLGYAVDVADPARRADFGSVQALAVDWESGTVTGFADDRRSAGFVVDQP